MYVFPSIGPRGTLSCASVALARAHSSCLLIMIDLFTGSSDCSIAVVDCGSGALLYHNTEAHECDSHPPRASSSLC